MSWYVLFHFGLFRLHTINDDASTLKTQDKLVDSLKRLPLTYLRLRVDVLDVNPRRTSPISNIFRSLYRAHNLPSPPPPPPPPPPCIAETSTARVHVPALLSELCDAIPTLVDAYVVIYRRSIRELWSGVMEREVGSEDQCDTQCWASMPEEEKVTFSFTKEELRRRGMFELDSR